MRPVQWILIVALALRVAAAFYLGDTASGLSGAHDEISYSELGRRYATGHGLTFAENWYPWIEAERPQSYFSVVMSLSLALVYKLFGYHPLAARLLMGLASTLLVWVLYGLAKQLFGERVALATALIAAGYAYLVFYGVTLVTETPFMLCVVAALDLAIDIRDAPSRGKWVLLGLFLGGATLLRMAVLFFVPVLLAWCAAGSRGRRVHALLPVLVIATVLAPFVYRNYVLWGHFALLETQFGHVFWNGNHPGHGGDFHPYEVFPIPPDVLANDNEVEKTNELLGRGIRHIMENPGEFLRLTATRLRELFKFWPTADSAPLNNILRVCSFGLMWPFAVAGMWITRRRWRDLLPLYLFLLVHTTVYSLSWTMIRYRVPMDAILLVFAAAAVVKLGERIGVISFSSEGVTGR